MRAALIANQQTITLGIVAAFLGFRVHRHQTTICVLGFARRNPLGHNARLSALAQMHHLGARVRLLHIIGDSDRIKLALAVITAQNAGRVFPCHC